MKVATPIEGNAATTWWSKLGPGLITGAADDDPSGIATYSQAGAQFGYAVGWTLLLTYPLMVGIQLASGKIGRVTGKGLAEDFSRFCPRWLVLGLVVRPRLRGVVVGAAGVRALRTLCQGPEMAHPVASGVGGDGLRDQDRLGRCPEGNACSCVAVEQGVQEINRVPADHAFAATLAMIVSIAM